MERSLRKLGGDASGLLTGRMRRDTAFHSADHRTFNRRGEAFDQGETFSGVDYEAGLAAGEELRDAVPEGGATMAQAALRWVTSFRWCGATCTIRTSWAASA